MPARSDNKHRLRKIRSGCSLQADVRRGQPGIDLNDIVLRSVNRITEHNIHAKVAKRLPQGTDGSAGDRGSAFVERARQRYCSTKIANPTVELQTLRASR